MHLHEHVPDLLEPTRLHQPRQNLELDPFDVELEQCHGPPEPREKRVEVDRLDLHRGARVDVPLAREEGGPRRSRDGILRRVGVKIQRRAPVDGRDGRLDAVDSGRAVEPAGEHCERLRVGPERVHLRAAIG